MDVATDVRANPDAAREAATDARRTDVAGGDTSGGGTGPDASVTTGPRLSRDVQPLFNLYCVGCHGGTSPAAGMSLVAGQAHRALVGVEARCTSPGVNLRVYAGQPRSSFLVHKLAGTQGCGVRMPAYRQPLSDYDISIVETWISLGAQDD